SNPPYVSRHNLNDDLAIWLKTNSEFCKKFNFDLYYYFIESALLSWNENGSIVLITPNSYLRAKSAKLIRQALVEKNILYKIYNFEDSLLFEDAQTYTAITVLRKNESGYFDLIKCDYDNEKVNLLS